MRVYNFFVSEPPKFNKVLLPNVGGVVVDHLLFQMQKINISDRVIIFRLWLEGLGLHYSDLVTPCDPAEFIDDRYSTDLSRETEGNTSLLPVTL